MRGAVAWQTASAWRGGMWLTALWRKLKACTCVAWKSDVLLSGAWRGIRRKQAAATDIRRRQRRERREGVKRRGRNGGRWRA